MPNSVESKYLKDEPYIDIPSTLIYLIVKRKELLVRHKMNKQAFIGTCVLQSMPCV